MLKVATLTKILSVPGGLAHPFWGSINRNKCGCPTLHFWNGGHYDRIPLGISVYRFRLDDVTDDYIVFYGTIKILR
jgi:hypothetical protein